MYSRLAQRNQKTTKQQSTLLLISSAIILILFIVYGFPVVLNLAGSIATRFGKKIATIKEQNPAPATPRFSQDFSATKSATITLHGVADPKISVEVFQNERSLGQNLTKDNGIFSLDVDLAKGDNIFTAQAISDSGQKSTISDSYIITYLNSNPKLDVTSPKDEDNFKDSPIVVQGVTESDVQITINDRFAIVGSDGKFNFSLNLNSGDNKIKVVATDKAGNQTVKEFAVKYNP